MANVWLLLPILATATGWLYLLTCLAPTVSAGEQTELRFPSSLQELQQLAKLLKLYYEKNWLYVLILFSSAYLYKQAFIIPGSALLNVLAGALFGMVRGFPLCCVLTAVGASSCFLLSHYLGRDVLLRLCPEKLNFLQAKVQSNTHQLIYFLLFLRLFPVTPNWLINLASPLVGVPLQLFFVTVLIGLMPYNFLCVQTGEMLTSLTSLDNLFSFRTLVQLALMASVALGPSFLLKKPLEGHHAS